MKLTVKYTSLVLAALCCIFCADKSYAAVGKYGLRTVVIDAGHGGKDPGAVSADRKTFEKTLALDIANKFAEKIKDSYPDVKVIMTRSDDKFVELSRRASIANDAGADLFISLHINAANNKSANGYSVHVLGQSSKKNRDLFAANMDICKRENSVITLYEEEGLNAYGGFDPDDPESFIFMQMMQNSHLEQSIHFAQIISQKMKASPLRSGNGVSQNPFLVLWKTAMPSVLVEMGYISNPDDLWTLRNASNRDAIADCLFQAFKAYKSQYDETVSVRQPASAQSQGSSAQSQGSSALSSPTKAASSQTTAAPSTAAAAKPAPAQSQGSSAASQGSSALDAPKKGISSQTTAAPSAAAKVRYGVQCFAVAAKVPAGDSRLMGYTPVVIPAGKVSKYIIGVSDTLQGAKTNLEKIRKRYPDAFLVKIEDGKAVRI